MVAFDSKRVSGNPGYATEASSATARKGSHSLNRLLRLAGPAAATGLTSLQAILSSSATGGPSSMLV